MTALINRLSRESQVVLWCIYHCNELVEAGILRADNHYEMTSGGRSEIERLMAEGFTPSDEEICGAMQFLLEPKSMESHA